MPLTPGFELVIDPPMIRRASAFMAGLDAARPADSVVSPIYLGLKKTLVVYGAGASSRKDYIARHVAEGGRVVYWDLAYWDRFRSMRLSIDGLHPTAEQLEGLYPGRPRRSFQLRNAYKKDGHILLIGLGPKSEKSLSVDAKAWATAKARALRDRFPDRRIIWRPKKYLFNVPGTVLTRSEKIQGDLQGCSLLVCQHSNAAVDACLAGVPVECESGAAFALYSKGSAPTPEARLAFLEQLSWWEWNTDEASATWSRLQEIAT